MDQDNACPTTLPAGTEAERIKKALEIAMAYGGIDGAHHKDWVIDQITRALTGCPVVTETVTTSNGEIAIESQGESQEYLALVADACAGIDGPETYGWDTGIAP